jgi:hypothetical protein
MSSAPDNHLKALWQGQETELKPMSVDAIRNRATRYATRRSWAFAFGSALMLAEIAIFGRYALILPSLGARIGMLAIVVGLSWMIARFSFVAPRRLPGAKASGETILEFHRTELQRQRETFGGLLITVGPTLLGVVVFVVGATIDHPQRALGRALPIVVMIGLWMIGAWWLVRRQERKRLRRLAEIEATRAE